MTDYRAVADRYIEIWNEPDPQRRRALISAAWGPDATYVDPLGSARGQGEIDTMIAGVRTQFAGLAFVLRGEPDGHGANVRFSWLLAPAGMEPVAGGTDVALLDPEGRLAAVVGFLDVIAPHA